MFQIRRGKGNESITNIYLNQVPTKISEKAWNIPFKYWNFR